MSMTETRFVSSDARRQVRNAPNTETALFLAVLAIGLVLLSLFAVVAFASFVQLAHILPLFALPLVLLVVSALFLRRWAAGEAAAKRFRTSSNAHRKGDLRGGPATDALKNVYAPC